MENIFLHEDVCELRHFRATEFMRAREFRGAFSFAVFTFPATAVVAIICANYSGPERAGLMVMMLSACIVTMAGSLWVARDTWVALRAVRWRIETLSARVNETI